MAQRHSEYARVNGEFYATPAWVTEALLSVERFAEPIWECAPGEGHMVKALEDLGFTVDRDRRDFFECDYTECPSIVTNPPFSLAEKFIRHALDLVHEQRGKVAMLLPMTFDAAKTRRDLFEHPAFKAKYTIVRRIRWANLEQKEAGPSTNHAWFVWDWKHGGPAIMGWLP